MVVDHKTAGFIGILNCLSMLYKKYGIKSLSEVADMSEPFVGIIYDDHKEQRDGDWHKCPIVNGMDGKSYSEMFNGMTFEMAWSDFKDDEIPFNDPNLWVYNDDITYHITKNGWYV